jgi:hypothetical protein
MKLELGSCPVERTLNVIGNRWVALVVWQLMQGRKRHGELLRLLPGISPKTLTDRLRELEGRGFVSREVFARCRLGGVRAHRARPQPLRDLRGDELWGDADADAYPEPLPPGDRALTARTACSAP